MTSFKQNVGVFNRKSRSNNKGFKKKRVQCEVSKFCLSLRAHMDLYEARHKELGLYIKVNG